MPFNLGPGEIILLAIFALILFGPKKLPEFGKALGESISAFKKAIYNQPDGSDASKDTVTPTAVPVAPASTPEPSVSAATSGEPVQQATTPQAEQQNPAPPPETNSASDN